ncbi:MAG: hypothetical protein H5T91_00630 [Synergistetes bacterium]|nr:MAG: hypothetical protein XD52_0454 [bacterium 42_11]MBC7330922.1 hypothetical protein [Synergistota bacterium]MDK2870883.1 hypothetical protein [bacterium]
MLEKLKEEVGKLLDGVLWERVESSGESYGCNLPEIVVFMGLKKGDGLIIAFSKELLKRMVASELNCDESLISEIELVNKARKLSLDLTKPISEQVVPYPAILRGNFMELMVHKATLHAYYGSLGREHIFIGMVQPIGN